MSIDLEDASFGVAEFSAIAADTGATTGDKTVINVIVTTSVRRSPLEILIIGK
ncbi:hypothetical protein GRX01_04980 [Halobaculum sp. WSA2]|uniref:Uncharacterized protein n=1 Tax=Halobaculum saliterrae TaxID=2073113 RepID=A0A6B0SXL7_9EURY|nr:hypothetical protein [Halobaculum saliterrae]MXR40700.1 hypothetical protein [Halobaculum saliterrae]